MQRTATARFRRSERTIAGGSVQDLLARNQLDTLDAVFARSGSAEQRHAGRSVCGLDCHDCGQTVRVFAKLSWGRQRIWPRMTDLKTGQVLQTLAEREWCGLETLERLGLPVAERLALLREGRLDFRAAVLVRAVPPQDSIESLLHTRKWWDLPAGDRDAILRGAVATLYTIHAAGYAWRGTCSRHFFPERQSDGRWKLWLIDCEGVHRLTSRKAIARDRRKLTDSMQESGADEATLVLLRELTDGGGRTARRAA